MSRVTIDIAKDYLSFSAAHFTIFSATERENLHGHNWQLAAAASAAVGDDGLCFDYVRLKSVMKRLCEELDETLLLPTQSPHLEIEEGAEEVQVHFSDERMRFLRRDVTLLPVRNVTVEELARWLGARIRSASELADVAFERLTVRVSSGVNQWAHVEVIAPDS